MSKDVVLTLALSSIVFITWMTWPEPYPECCDVEWQSLLRWRGRLVNTTALLARCRVDTYAAALNVTHMAWRGAVVRSPTITLCFRIASSWRSLVDMFAIHGMPPPMDTHCYPPN